MNMEHFFPNKEQFDTMNRILCAIASNGGGITVNSWRDVQSIVRLGLADKVFSIGDQLVCMRGEEELVWDIIDFDHDVPANKLYTHSMTLQLHQDDTRMNRVQFNKEDAMYYCDSGALPAGTYWFSFLDGIKTRNFCFTLTEEVPQGGTLQWRNVRFNENDLSDGNNIETHASKTDTQILERVQVIEGSDGTELASVTVGKINLTHATRFGRNDWLNCALRQFLNSKNAVGNVWTSQTDFDKVPTSGGMVSGFLNEIDEDFLSVIGKVKKWTIIGENEELTEHEELVFIPSVSEVNGAHKSGIKEEGAYAYYTLCSELTEPGNESDGGRVKYKTDGNARMWWLRSSVGKSVYNVIHGGEVLNTNVNTTIGVYPICNII